MKKDGIITIVGVAIVIAACIALAAVRGFDVTPPKPSPATAASGSDAKAGDAKGDKVVMRINGEPVTEREFNLLLEQIPEQQRPFVATDEGRALLAKEYVQMKVLEQEGERRKLDQDPDLDARLALDRMNLLASHTLRKIVPEPTDAELKAEYEAQKSKVEGYELSHIMIAVQGSPVPPRSGQQLTRQQAAQKAQEIIAAVRRGQDFSEIAKAESDDPESASQGGFLGVVSPSAFPPEIAQALTKLKEGEISGPVASQYGVHVFKMGKKTSQPFDQIKPALRQSVQRKKADEMVTKLNNDAKVEYDPVFFPPAAREPKQPAQPPAAPKAPAPQQ